MVTAEAISEIYDIAERDINRVTTPDQGFLAAAKEENFGVFFGRDSLIDCLFTLETAKLHPEQVELLEPVRASLITLANSQGTSIDNWRDEEPGKIVHELRDDMDPNNLVNQQRLKELKEQGWPVEERDGVLFMKYYGGVDSTLLFVKVCCDYLAKDPGFFGFLDGHIRGALAWMENYGDMDKDGYIKFSAKNRNALLNQNWKDSGCSILTKEGTRPKEPLALVEVQGYAYAAYIAASGLYEEKDPEFASGLKQKAETLKANFNRDFWMEDEGFFAHALDGDKKQVCDIVSNVGHLLATGIIDEEKVPKVVSRLMQPDMLTPYGIRTLSVESPNFSDEEPVAGDPAEKPNAYQNGGGIWTHDNTLIYLGLKMLGYLKETVRVRNNVLEAQDILYKQYGICDMELYIVDRFNRLRPYSDACMPQSWVATAYRLLADPKEINKIIMALHKDEERESVLYGLPKAA